MSQRECMYLYKEEVGSSIGVQFLACRKCESGPENVNMDG